MIRLFRRSLKFLSTSKFYQPTEFKYDPDHHQLRSGKLHYYVGLFRKYGHHSAELDPLKLYNQSNQFAGPADFQLKQDYPLDQLSNTEIGRQSKNITDLTEKLGRVYKSKVGVEFDHVSSLEELTWLYDNYQKAMLQAVPANTQKQIAELLIQTEALDHFIHKKFNTFKRYSGEGAQSAVVALKTILQSAAQAGVSDIVMGIPHRGRLNVLVNLLDYPTTDLLRKISGKTDTPSDLIGAIDDVTSHIAQSIVKTFNTSKGNKDVHITTVHNPSHLQAQNAVSMGKTHSKQINKKTNILNVQIHGDAAFSAQGIVYESLCLSKVPYFKIDGTVHMIVNNQIGYTTKPLHSRSSKYCSDVVKAFGIPIIHVNGQSAEDVYRVAKFVIQYRQKFKKDILIDLVCYRRYGHNEVDEPQFTQPLMYKQIRTAQTTYPKVYFEWAKKNGVVSQNAYQEIRKNFFSKLQSEFNRSKQIESIKLESYSGTTKPGSKSLTNNWQGFRPSFFGTEQPTNVNIQFLKEFARASAFVPPKFVLHSKIQRYFIQERIKSIEKNALNWATCEALALFSLNAEGYNIRLTGQDVERGTFSQRHINLTDQNTQEEFNPLKFFSQQAHGRGNVEICNSPLSQNAVMSYEYGFSIDNPNNLAIWQAQFGDFFNPAQVVVDTYVTNSQAKWLRQSGLVLLLPHGYDGAGPQHSSCRIQRFLQAANTNGINRNYKYQKYNSHRQRSKIGQQIFYQNIQDANFSFVYPTQPANFFHIIRRQMKRNFRKPLIIAGPKTLLKHPKCVSKFQDMSQVTHFKRIIHYTPVEQLKQAKTLILCYGKFVYDLMNLISTNKTGLTSIVTIEQLFPFPQQQIKEVISKTNESVKVLWVQQQNINSGAYMFVQPHISRVLKQTNRGQLKYAGRRALATTAVGSSELHNRESKQLTEFLLSELV